MDKIDWVLDGTDEDCDKMISSYLWECFSIRVGNIENYLKENNLDFNDMTIEEWVTFIEDPKKRGKFIAELEAEYGKDYEAIKLMKMDDV